MQETNAGAGRPVILVVEDELLVRMHAVEVIKAAGFGVLEAGNADEAIGLLETCKDIRIVFTDVEMPGSMDGLKLARAVRDRWPPIELIITSGRHRLTPDDIPPRGQFVPKPYNPDALLTTIKKMAC